MDSAISLIGLMYKAGKLLLGDSALENMKKVKYLLIASDASDKTKERFIKKCEYYQIEFNMSLTSEQLSKALGKGNIKIIGITDEGFVSSFKSKI